MCSIHFDEQAVRDAFLKRAQNDKTPLPVVNPNQIFRDLYDGPVGGVKLYFIQKIKRAMVEEALRNAFVECATKEQRHFHQVHWGVATNIVFERPTQDLYNFAPPSEWFDEYKHTNRVARDVQYDLMIEESRAGHAGQR